MADPTPAAGDDPDVLYFAYGSNMDPRRMSERAPRARALGPGRLDGFHLEFNLYSTEWEGGVTNLEPDAGAHVWGILWQMPRSELDALNAYHGHPTFYRQEEVVVEGPPGRVLAYSFRVAHQSGYIRPTDAYLNRIRSAIRVQGLPPEALEILERAGRPPRPSISS